jgi:hypothetical protein
MSQIKAEIGVDDEPDKGCNRCDDLCKIQSPIMKNLRLIVLRLLTIF